MRLLTWSSENEIVLADSLDGDVPPYAILSHTWGPDNDEVTLEDVRTGQASSKRGYAKIQFCGTQARKDRVQYFWVDTCCIDKKSESELSEAIRSMFQWYKNAQKCYVFLSDVSAQGQHHNESMQQGWGASFRDSRWFTRGWTLQELLAPDIVQFFSREGIFLGDKQTLMQQISEITGIPIMALSGTDLDQFSIDERIRWTKTRRTKRKEDEAYCLLGIFGVHMPLLYGEGEYAFHRLRKEINDRWGENVASHLGGIIKPTSSEPGKRMAALHEPSSHWVQLVETEPMSELSQAGEPRRKKRARVSYNPSSSSSGDIHTFGGPVMDLSPKTVPNRHVQYVSQDVSNASLEVDENESLVDSLLFDRIDFRVNNVKRALSSTCQWLLDHPSFRAWYDRGRLDEHSGFFWIRGKPGCGKSTLMKIALEWVQKQQKKGRDRKVVVPYFFNARAPATLEKSRLGMYRTVAHHLVSQYPAFRALFTSRFAFKNPELLDDKWTAEELEGFLEDVVEIKEPFQLYLFIDALDEAEYDDDIRRMISFLIQLSERVAGTDELCKLRICLSSRHYPYIKIGKGLSLVVEAELEHRHDIEKYVMKELTCNDGPESEELRARVLSKSSGIFLWVVLVVRILNRLDDNGTPFSEMMTRLEIIPEDLHQLFYEILTRNDDDIEITMLLFQWMAFCMRPLDPAELFVAIEYSKSPHDESWSPDVVTSIPSPDRLDRFILNCSHGLVEIVDDTQSSKPIVQFIHETVREFLLEEDGLAAIIPALTVNITEDSHEILRVACYRRIATTAVPDTYKRWGVGNPGKQTDPENPCYKIRSEFPFLQYAISRIFDHAEEAQKNGISQEDFLHAQTDEYGYWKDPFRLWWNINDFGKTKTVNSDMPLVHHLTTESYQKLPLILLKTVQKSTVTCGKYGSLLCTASEIGHNKVVKLLLDRAIEADEQGQNYGRALQLASVHGHEAIARMLLEGGARINTKSGSYGNALKAASIHGHAGIVRMIPKRDARDDMQECHYNEALLAASLRGHENTVQVLLDMGVDVNAQDASAATALQRASENGHKGVIQILLDGGANINAQESSFGTALTAAIFHGQEEIVQTLLDRDADVNAQGESYGNALIVALSRGNERIVRMLLDRGADVNAQGSANGNALTAAVSGCHERILQIFLASGTVNTRGKSYDNALSQAISRGNQKIMRMLLDHKAAADPQRV